jgi:hypothetical protein
MAQYSKEFTTDTPIFVGYSSFSGVSIAATAAAVVTLHDGTDNTGPVVARLHIPANDMRSIMFTERVMCNDGLYVDVVSGTVAGVVYF